MRKPLLFLKRVQVGREFSLRILLNRRAEATFQEVVGIPSESYPLFAAFGQFLGLERPLATDRKARGWPTLSPGFGEGWGVQSAD
jgi:hypothetical protein